MVLTDDKIEELISCKKNIYAPPRKKFYEDKQNSYTLRNEFYCESECKTYKFHIFLKRNKEINEAFSIGLRLVQINKNKVDILLLRVNGCHYHKNKIGGKEFKCFHVHKANSEQLTKSITNSFDAEISNEYINFETALLFFGQTCAIIDIEKHFGISSLAGQISFFEEN